jgi:hypothetical protein
MKSIKNKTYLLKPVWYVKDLFFMVKNGDDLGTFVVINVEATDKMSNKTLRLVLAIN